MASRFTAGDTVQTRFGKGIVREVLNRDRLMVDVQGRAFVVSASEISAVDPGRQRSRSPVSPRRSEPARNIHPKPGTRTASAKVDLHGLTVEEALERVDQALNEALLADLSELRFIHGRSGGRIRNSLHRRLRETSAVRKFRLDPRNEGVTIVTL